MRVVDLFCGAGGSSAGARAAGCEIAGAIDAWPLATDTFAANFPGAHVVTSRLADVAVPAFRRAVGDIDLLLASPECTSHTWARGSTPRSEASRSTALHVLDYAAAFQPRWIVVENVVAMRRWPRYAWLLAGLQELGYHVAEQVLDASQYGVPQSRRRLFLVADRRHAPRLVTPARADRPATARSILDPPGTWPSSPLFTPRRAAGTLERARRACRALGPTASFLLVYYGSDGAGGWQSLDRPLRTVTTVDRFAVIDPGPGGPMMRMLQVPELKRAMAFDDTFVLPYGTRRERIRLLGNAVCPPVMAAVVRALTEGGIRKE